MRPTATRAQMRLPLCTVATSAGASSCLLASSALLYVLLSCCAHFGAGKMQHTTNRLQAGVHLSGYGLYSAPEHDNLAETTEREKETVSLHFDLGPEDDVGLKVLEACERKGLSEDGCDAVMQQVGSRFSGKLKALRKCDYPKLARGTNFHSALARIPRQRTCIAGIDVILRGVRTSLQDAAARS